MKSPLVSIIMPAYNAERYIREAVDSVTAQTHRNWELIIIDDRSNDNTADIALEYHRLDPRIRLIKNEDNLGAAGSRNRGLDEASGDYVALLDADDVWLYDKLSKQLELAERSGGGLIYCSYFLLRDNGEKAFIVPPVTDYEHMLSKNVIGCSTVLMSREIADEFRFSTEYYHEDLVMWLDILRGGRTAFGCTECLAKHRQVKSSRSADKLSSARNRWRILRDYLELPLPKCCTEFAKYAFFAAVKYLK